ncbi:pyruvate dehydrogenase (acetyl-transferring) kinase isozyme 3 mitochondrial [Biomphalaria glabrata]|uniref:Protein-serine/threonine kinase n=1 Tax=Biomphalaria glabrata TaxID=6526 RepID=A0A2C9JLI9_BIOGL|nr:pyruvate dehydrogenase (acetyl-transferring) kinase isozyme 3, mitochondrial-like isoform X2 [Biomphalaria glabrata]XP_013072019.1 pyruvate dehydrogenase (acetyl-transferring) kinase isozyme 3, mitochondrial-like isoform X2 [Biomphalaria glabrata]XP_013072021.1 pyruvate dehydrogenase (acetyl-transferring) kinase isozyme 3, mitochondrial-like isoform X2 [Biomphalaria glabrata]XP_013072022.1 pyruvate dehydrogenase (acetyl-transferring) kinase isozyme 3, mitochondrial-like isoform X2 [Biomphalar
MRLTIFRFRAITSVASANILKFEKYASFNPSPLSLKKLLEFGRTGQKNGSSQQSYIFLQKELPVRLANIMKEINLLPENLLKMPSVQLVISWYQQSFKELIEFENKSSEDQKIIESFTSTLVNIRNRHTNVVETMAQGVLEMKEAYGIDTNSENRIQYFLDRFYMSRISIRMLINQHTLLFGKREKNNDPRHIGCIDPNCNVLAVVQDAYENARFLCEQYYLAAPDMMVKTHNNSVSECETDPIQIAYVPSHLYHMLFELFKNAMRAVTEYHSDEGPMPLIKVMIVKGQEDVTIKISDQGGGIPRSKIDLLFQYMYSTAPQPARSDIASAPLAGYGYGLPLSRLYARYFQGDILLASAEGYGTDACIYLKVLSNEANEVLPVYNKTADKVYHTDIPVNDWSSPWSTNQRSFHSYTK